MDTTGSHHDPLQSTEIWEGPLGSFGESDSPPRGSPSGYRDHRSSSLFASPHGSPPLSHYQSMRFSDYSTPYGQDREWHQKSMSTAHATPGHFHGRPFHYNTDPVWRSPPPVDDLFAASARTSPLTRLNAVNMAMTPSNKPTSNLFRSPPGKGFNRSPLRASPHFGLSSSFGMVETPDPQLADAFSPVGPSLVYFEPSGDEHHPKIALTRSSSGEIDAPPLPQRSLKKDSSFSGFLNEFITAPPSGALHGVTRSPVRKATKNSATKVSPSKSAISRASRIGASTSLQASPVLPSSEVKPTKLWNDGTLDRQMPSAPRNRMRLELGQVGAKYASTQQSFEGINNMMRASNVAYHSAQAYRNAYPPHMYAQPHLQAHRYASQSHVFQNIQPVSTPKTQTTLSSSTPAELPKLIPPSTVKTSHKSVPASEDSATKESDFVKRSCNCKNSKCLKLYCFCFSAKAYCDGCKCVDCNNLPQFDDLREKAIQNARAKNPTAFQQSTSGCRCKRSYCLKKYCDCFVAGQFCGPSCKCVDCQNLAGSQTLIDKRRKMKDSKGAEYAVRVAHEVWQGQRAPQQGPPVSPGNMRSSNLPAGAVHGHQMSQGTMSHRGYMHPAYMTSSVMGHIGYSTIGVPPVTPMFGQQQRAHEMQMRAMMQHYKPEDQSTKATETKSASSKKRPCPETSTPVTASKNTAPRTPPVRIEFDPSSSRKSKSEEEMLSLFGDPKQPKHTILNVFSFLTNADIYNASIVSKEWGRIALDKELWEYNG
ncbi:hypothetical protein FisN_1Lh290 [Fistulifera solaris]|uniref:CRC domain-containing protein n=1 Tax=Fistulifera solaris TaxID=1519565 RepID=A0A1Z5K4Y7_FISSO|nr:hypothetical protein FisN_1Lh290 [Fistulifera solaris]|eukprot:GAX21038.1 hypothetical protein FisN_1Lh290 [Fistulifera solaris]